ncbi:lysozyme inhibitor LprI family protein [Parasulfitobacter algicola]|uniref:DUF1311 domain-containing protein n=1 Tax=Parasulfitobacter algicola TaxID=2614809 RepID=A0ABX2IND0_9RHOB|nr:lysozyme inhibitor LprI family protein [Sulfitobacter algicola]NSX54394.1 DUF1311 domain-containing protein [Sulfitobacter algicola]
MRFYLFILAFLCPMALWADCMNTARTQPEMTNCAKTNWQTADNALNNAWSQLKPAYDCAGLGDDLLTAQRNWLTFRDTQCMAERNFYRGGSIEPMIYFVCLERLTERRTEDLLKMMGPA